MRNYFIILRALFKNKLRFDIGASKRGKTALLCVLGIAYALVMAALLTTIIGLKELLAVPLYSMMFYFFVLLTGALIVLIFGIINLVSTLYLSKDTDFYSMLPVKSSTVFAAKLTYVYLSEAAIITAVILPLIITFGIIVKAWAAFYIISVLMLIIVPALPLMVAAIFAVPVMFLASKLKNRSMVSLIFYIVLFGGGFALYIYFMFSSTNMTSDGVITEEALEAMYNSIQTVLYILYPYSALSLAALGLPAYGLDVGASTAVNLLIFVGISVVLIVILMLLGKFMYAQSAKANNQTNDKAKKGDYKTSSGLTALIKREYVSAFRTTQVAFQCYVVFLLPIIFAVMFSLVFGNMEETMGVVTDAIDNRFTLILTFSTLMTMLITVNNAAATTYSREGTALSSLKILPVSAKYVFNAKVLAWLIIALPATAVAVIIVNAFNFNLEYLFLSFFSFIPLCAAFVVFGALWDIMSPRLKWTDPRQAIKHNLRATIGQVFGIICGLVLIIVFIALLSNGVSMDVISIVCWSYIYGILAVFVTVDVVLYGKLDKYYNRIEI